MPLNIRRAGHGDLRIAANDDGIAVMPVWLQRQTVDSRMTMNDAIS
jgi:hypothetical protein